MNQLRYLFIAIVFLTGLFCFTACQKNDGTSEDVKNEKDLENVKIEEDVQVAIEDKHDKYDDVAKKYCADNNLVLDKYLGMTVISFKDSPFDPKSKEPAPVVYEWEVHNRASNQKLILGVGPIMPMLSVGKPPVMLTTGRYTFKRKMKIK